ncbi:MAG: sensor histidine kinase [Ferruginibacter sp.]
MKESSVKIKSIFVLYWIFLAYILAALIWWYIALSRQNEQIASQQKQLAESGLPTSQTDIDDALRRKHLQYIGEGAIFLLLIAGGAIYLFRAVKKQLRLSRQQQDFMMAVTHELKTPIAVSKLNLETLQRRRLEENQMTKLLQNTVEEVDRMNDLCNNLLLSSNMESGIYRIQKEEIDLPVLAEHTATEYRRRFPDRIIELHTASDCLVYADPFLIEIALNNLLDNALKYSPKSGRIQLQVNQHEQHIQVIISDEGPGIAASDKKKIFDKFYRAGSEATQRSKGTGLGLYLVKRIMDTHNGSVTVEDVQPHGARFILRINQR